MKTNPGSLMHLMPLDEAQHQISCCMALLMTLRSELQNLSAEAEAQSVFKVQHISLLEMALEEANRNIELAFPQWCAGDERRQGGSGCGRLRMKPRRETPPDERILNILMRLDENGRREVLVNRIMTNPGEPSPMWVPPDKGRGA